MSELPKFGFNSHFEKIIIKEILKNNKSFTYWIGDLRLDYFNTSYLSYFFGKIKIFHETEKHIPTAKILWDLIRTDSTIEPQDRRQYLKLLNKLRKTPVLSADIYYVLQRVELFVKRQKYLKAFEDGLELLDKDDIKSLDTMFTKVIRTGQQEAKNGLRYFQDIKQRLYTILDHRRRYKLLIPELDECLRNEGLKAGETLFWLAPPGAGKTMGLVHTAKAFLLQKLKGVYYTLQLPEEDIAERFDSSFSGVPIRELLANSKNVESKILKIGRQYGDSLIIKYFSRRKANIGHIRRHLEQLKSDGFYPSFIIIDFLNYLRPEHSTQKDTKGSLYFEGGDVAGEFISLCQEEKYIGATGIQANRTGSREDVVTLSHVAQSFEMAMEATLVISVNRTASERQEERARLFIAKYSFGEDQIMIPINTNYKKGSLYRR